MTTSNSRIYRVKNKASGAVRLVRAKSNIAAVNHVVGDAYDTKQASADDVVEAMAAGVAVEAAAEPTPPAPPAPPTPPAQ